MAKIKIVNMNPITDDLMEIMGLVTSAYFVERKMSFCDLDEFNKRVLQVCESMPNFSEEKLKDEAMRMYPHYIQGRFEDVLAEISNKIDKIICDYGIDEEEFKNHKELNNEFKKRKETTSGKG